MTNEDQLDVIAIGAHPDDVEIGCGGTIAKLVAQGYRVGIIDLTDGEPTPESAGPEIRLAEAQEAARILGVQKRVTLPLTNRRLMDTPEARFTLATVLRTHRPRMVLAMGHRTPLASPDHWQAVQMIEAGIFYSRLTKWDHEFQGTPPHRVEQLVYYSLELYSLESPGPNAFVFDITGHLETKLAAVRAYITQFPPAKQALMDHLAHSAHYFGRAAGFVAGERLWSPRAIGVRELLSPNNTDT